MEHFVINATWHRKNRMPQRPTAAQRLRWHLAHAKACNCRELTPSTLEKLRVAARKEKAARK
jgi:hypothetical protein